MPGGTSGATVTRRRRRRRLPAAAVGAAALLAGATAVSTAGVSVASPGRVVVDGTAATHVADLGPRGAVVLRYEHGRVVTYAFEVRNDGWLPATVTGVVLAAPDERPLLVPVAARPAVAAPSGADAYGFAPVVLRPGATHTVRVTARMDNCAYYTERALQRIEHHTLRLHVGGIPVVRDLVLADDVVVRSPSIRRCRDRVIDRGAHRR